MWLDYLKKRGISLDIKDVLVHLIMNERDRDASSLTLDTIVCFYLICRRDAHTMAQYLPSTPDPNFLDMRQAYGTKISHGLCSCFFCLHNRSPLAQEITTDQESSRPIHISYFFMVEPSVSTSAGATPPLYGIVHGLLGWNSRVCGGYEVDICLLCSPHPRCFVALFSPL